MTGMMGLTEGGFLEDLCTLALKVRSFDRARGRYADATNNIVRAFLRDLGDVVMETIDAEYAQRAMFKGCKESHGKTTPQNAQERP